MPASVRFAIERNVRNFDNIKTPPCINTHRDAPGVYVLPKLFGRAV